MIESKYLKADTKNIQQLSPIPALESFDTRDLSNLLRLSKIRRYEEGELIIQEGDSDNWLYFLLTGTVRISKNGVDLNALYRTGDLFGEMRLIDGLSRSASVYSVGRVICLAVDFSAADRLAPDEDMQDLLQLLYRAMAQSLATRLRLSNEGMSDNTRRDNATP